MITINITDASHQKPSDQSFDQSDFASLEHDVIRRIKTPSPLRVSSLIQFLSEAEGVQQEFLKTLIQRWSHYEILAGLEGLRKILETKEFSSRTDSEAT